MPVMARCSCVAILDHAAKTTVVTGLRIHSATIPLEKERPATEACAQAMRMKWGQTRTTAPPLRTVAEVC